MMRMINKLNKILYAAKYRLCSIMPESAEEKVGRKRLQDKVRNLPELVATNESDLWTAHRNELRRDLLTRDPRFFLTWPYIIYTMFHESKKSEYEELVSKPYWEQWKGAAKEVSVGFPPKYIYAPTSSGNLIHNAYSLAQVMDGNNIDFSQLEIIVEFGGGYGSMARLIYNLGFKGTYIIFDLPEFLALQEYFLDLIGVPNVLFVDSCEKMSDVLGGKKVDLFIATWSLSESPIHLRDQVLKIINGSKYYLIAYQNMFDNMDNSLYFKNIILQNDQVSWKNYSIAQLPKSNYLIGKKK